MPAPTKRKVKRLANESNNGNELYTETINKNVCGTSFPLQSPSFRASEVSIFFSNITYEMQRDV